MRLLLACVLALTACSSAPVAPVPPPAERVWELRYDLLDRYPTFAFCDPDEYPVSRPGGEAAGADAWWQQERDSIEARVIVRRRGFREPLDAAQRVTAYRDHKKMTVIQMDAGADGYTYTLAVASNGGDEPDSTVTGTITNAGVIAERRRAARVGGCPICLRGATRIDTPTSAIAVSRVRVGDRVYSVDEAGRRIIVRVERVVRRATVAPHLKVRLVFRDGRTLTASGAHPVVGARLLRDLVPGEDYDGSIVATVSHVLSRDAATYDILPAGATGFYWADGILVASTLHEADRSKA